jgi:hypothetical protein
MNVYRFCRVRPKLSRGPLVILLGWVGALLWHQGLCVEAPSKTPSIQQQVQTQQPNANPSQRESSSSGGSRISDQEYKRQLSERAAAKERHPASGTRTRATLPTEVSQLTYVMDATILDVAPKTLSPAAELTVDLKLTLQTPVSLDDLASELIVYLDGQPLDSLKRPTPKPIPPQDSSGAASKPESVPQSANKTPPTRLTLFARAPAALSRGREMTLAVYSMLDHRNIAFTQVYGPPLPPVPTQNPGPKPTPWWYVGGPLGLLLAVLAAAWAAQRKSKSERLALEYELAKERSRLNATVAARGADKAPDQTTPKLQTQDLQVPEVVMTALRQSELAVVLGPGVAAAAGLPTGASLWLAVIDRLERQLPGGEIASLRSVIMKTGTDAVVEPLLSLAGRERLVDTLVAELSAHSVNITRVHTKLGDLSKYGLHRFVDLTWDPLLQSVLAPLNGSVYTGQEQDSVSDALRGSGVTLLKPYGHTGAPQSLVLTAHEFRKRLAQAPELERCIAYLFSTQTLLFIGMGTTGIEQFLSSLPPELESSGREHFAFVPNDWSTELWSKGFAKRFGITVLPAEGFQVPEILDVMVQNVRRLPLPPSVTADRGALTGMGKITALDLVNIGNFTDLHVDFAESWNLFLGDNGGGKSTILRAITLALAGGDPRGEGMAARLLRVGEKTGSIELSLGNLKVRTRLTRDVGRVVVSAPQVTPLQAGQALVLGFPALRGVTTTQSTGPTQMTALQPSVEDVAPLLQEKVDTRLNQLKQWVINTAIQSEGTETREAQMFTTFKNILRDIVPGRHVEYSRIDRKTWTVWLHTDDGEVSFDSLSQGTSSILAWVGVLLQRLYDTYPGLKSPETASALVLIDEIDAHLHPRWQRKLVSLTRAKFPNIQMIASSHSPLLAGAVKHGELRIVERDPTTGRVVAIIPAEDVAGQKVDDILTSSLFALPTTRSPAAEGKIKEYFSLFEKHDRTQQDEARLRALESELDQLNYGPTVESRKAHDSIRQTLSARVDNIPPELAGSLTARFASGGSESGGASEAR